MRDILKNLLMIIVVLLLFIDTVLIAWLFVKQSDHEEFAYDYMYNTQAIITQLKQTPITEVTEGEWIIKKRPE